MKINRTFFALIYVALIFFAGAFYSAKTAQQIRNDDDIRCREEIRKQLGTPCISRFFYSNVPEANRNYADYIAIGLFVVATSTILAAIWAKKLSD